MNGHSYALDHKREYRRFDWHRDYRRECEQEYEPVCEHGGSYDCKECEKKMEIENER